MRPPKITNIKQLEKLLAEQKQKIRQAVSPFKNDNPKKQKRRLKRAKRDRFYFYRTYLPHYFTLQPSWHHREIDEHCEIRNSITLVEGARETGKTVQVAIGYAFHQGAFNLRNFILYDAHTEDLSTERLVAIRAEFESNPRIIHDFGDQMQLGLWEMDDFTLRSGTRYLALGYRGHHRGKLAFQHRVDLIVIEDYENKQTSRNPKISIQKKEHVLEDLYPMLRNGNILWLTNMPGKKCAAALFKEETAQNTEFAGRRFCLFYPLEYDSDPPAGAIRNGETAIPAEIIESRLLWPSVKDREYCDLLRATVGTVAYEREYKLNPMTEGRIFQEDWFRPLTSVSDILRSVIYIDPSFGKSKHACAKAVILLGWTGKKYKTADAWIRQAGITDMIEALYAMRNRWKDAGINLVQCYCESNYGQLDRLKHDLDAAAKRHKFRLSIMPYENKTDKYVRIEGVSGIIERGDAEYDLSNPDVRELREQFVFYPDHTLTDGPDAWEGAKAVLDMTNTDWTQEVISKLKRTFKRARMT